ncbi:hypothetical protein C8Q80DRAFT_1180653 [Daedaleopsis nitida]|nr:hypothetical protein C8Q80DRAFT_1180653 [Daedaleopsis nitida]
MSDPATSAAPRPQAGAVDTAAVRELLGAMKATLGTLDQTFRTLNEQSSQVSSLGPNMQTAAAEILALRQQIRKQEKRQEKRVNEIKRMLKEDIKLQAEEQMRDGIRAQIRSEIVKQVKDQMAAQIPAHLPVPLRTQAAESRQQLAEVKIALDNSEARRANAILRPSPSNMTDTLSVVLKPDGTKSALYPANLRSLFSYENAKMKELLKDFGLHDYGVPEKNLNRFMAHIGIRFEIVPMPASATSPRRKVGDPIAVATN